MCCRLPCWLRVWGVVLLIVLLVSCRGGGGHQNGFGVVWVVVCVCLVHVGLLPRLLLHDLWAGMSRLLGLPASTWSAVHGSFCLAPSWHNQQVVALSRTALARF